MTTQPFVEILSSSMTKVRSQGKYNKLLNRMDLSGGSSSSNDDDDIMMADIYSNSFHSCVPEFSQINFHELIKLILTNNLQGRKYLHYHCTGN